MTQFHFLDLQGMPVLTPEGRYPPEVTLSKNTAGPAHTPNVLGCLPKTEAMLGRPDPPCLEETIGCQGPGVRPGWLGTLARGVDVQVC